MKASIRWIKELIPDLRARPTAIAQRLTAAGLEVEGVDNEADALEGVICGEVRELEPHPNADRLRVAQLFDGEVTRTVVCGAPNVAAGQKVAYAPSGLTLPNGLTLERRAIRGVDSDGMICSEAELGLSDEADGILVLKPRTRPGKPLVDVLDLKDVVLELGITPNRADALSHLGLARELAALYRLSPPRLSLRVREGADSASELARVEIKDKRCSRYFARVLTGIKVGPSPSWVQRRLRSVGLRPISNVVDATNLVMMELGHPLHGFDLDRLAQSRVVVRAARGDETITLLDKSEQKLTPNDLVIADAEKPVALAGVMGGANSEVHDETTRVLLEAAVFDPRAVRATARSRGLHTDASHRFERGVDPNVVEHAIDRCAQLILELAGGVIHKGRIGVDKGTFEPSVVGIRPERASLVVGRPFDKKEIRDSLVALGLKPVRRPTTTKRPTKKKAALRRTEKSEEALFFQTPSWRIDLTREEDLIEEVARLAGYDDLPALMPPGPSDPWTGPIAFDPENIVREQLVSEGFLEAISLAFHGEDVTEAFGFEARSGVRLANPLGEERGLMRMSLLPALLRAARHNQDQLPSITDLRLFEVGRTFQWPEKESELPDQPRRVALMMRGRRRPAGWFGEQDGSLDAYDLKAVVETVLAAFSVADVAWQPAERPWLHPRSATRLEASGEVLGMIGEAHPDLIDRYGLEGPSVFIAELDIDALASVRGPRAVFTPLPKHPPAQRDLSFFVDHEVPAADILGAMRGSQTAVPLEALALFDVYEGEGVPQGKKSLAVKLTFRAGERTLNDQEIENAQSAIVEALKTRFNVQIRDSK